MKSSRAPWSDHGSPAAVSEFAACVCAAAGCAIARKSPPEPGRRERRRRTRSAGRATFRSAGTKRHFPFGQRGAAGQCVVISRYGGEALRRTRPAKPPHKPAADRTERRTTHHLTHHRFQALSRNRHYATTGPVRRFTGPISRLMVFFNLLSYRPEVGSDQPVVSPRQRYERKDMLMRARYFIVAVVQPPSRGVSHRRMGQFRLLDSAIP